MRVKLARPDRFDWSVGCFLLALSGIAGTEQQIRGDNRKGLTSWTELNDKQSYPKSLCLCLRTYTQHAHSLTYVPTSICSQVYGFIVLDLAYYARCFLVRFTNLIALNLTVNHPTLGECLRLELTNHLPTVWSLIILSVIYSAAVVNLL